MACAVSSLLVLVYVLKLAAAALCCLLQGQDTSLHQQHLPVRSYAGLVAQPHAA
jgi:hypothetical protein